MKLHETIYTLRTARGMSQLELAEALEVSRQSISKWETGSAVPELEKLIRMADIFGVSLDALARGTAEPTEEGAQETASPHQEKTAPPPEEEVPPHRYWYQEIHRIIGLIILFCGLLLGVICLSFGAYRSGILLALSVGLVGALLLLIPRRHLLWGVSALWLLFLLAQPYIIGIGYSNILFMLTVSLISGLLLWRIIRRFSKKS